MRLLAKLQANPDMSQCGLAAILKVSIGSVDYCLKALLAKGVDKAESFTKVFALPFGDVAERTRPASIIVCRICRTENLDELCQMRL